MTDAEMQETIAWMRSRTQVVKDLLVRFPPLCHVKGTKPLNCPPVGAVGAVVTWYEEGTVGVSAPGVSLIGQCEPDWLEVVGYEAPFTPEFVADVLKDAPAA